jgi:crossover junction endodeoxyribonuclease RuvC
MRVLAIDPGFGRCGVAIVDGDASSAHIIYSNCIETEASSVFTSRLLHIANEVKRLIEVYIPELVAIEELYFTNNQKTVSHVAEVRGVLIYLAVEQNIPLVEYNPLAIKIALTGHGRATKQEVIRMVERLTDLTKKPDLDDEYDAIALGVTALAGARTRALESRFP